MLRLRKRQQDTQPSSTGTPSNKTKRSRRSTLLRYNHVVGNQNRYQNPYTSRPESNVSHTFRKQAVGDIKKAEKVYVERLELVIKHFARPLKRLLNNDTTYNEIFGQFISIHNASKELLCNLKSNTNGVRLAFTHFIPIFQVYGSYASNFKDVMLVLQNMTNRNLPLRHFIESKEVDIDVQSSLNSLMQTPIHRLSCLKAQIDQLLIYTHIEHGDYDSLLGASNEAHRTLLNINIHIEQQRLLQMLINVQNSLLDQQPLIIQSLRFVVKEGILLKHIGNGYVKKRYCVLMSDILMYCKMKRERAPNKLVPNSLECCSIFPLTKCYLTEVTPFNFKVCCETEIAAFRSTNRHVARTWVSFIRNGITMCKMSSGLLHDHKKAPHIMAPTKRYVCMEDYAMPFRTGCMTDSESDYEPDATLSVPQIQNIRRRVRVPSTPIRTISSPIELNMAVARSVSPIISSISIGTDHDYAALSTLNTGEPILGDDLDDENLLSDVQNHWTEPVGLDAPPPPRRNRYVDPFDNNPTAHMTSHELNLIQDHPLFVLKDLMKAPHSSTREIVYDFFYQATQIL